MARKTGKPMPTPGKKAPVGMKRPSQGTTPMVKGGKSKGGKGMRGGKGC